MKEKYSNKKHTKINPYCYLESQYIIRCDMQYGSNCPRVCRLFDKEQGESLDTETIKGIENLLNKS